MLRRVLRLCRVAWGRSIGERPFNFMEVGMTAGELRKELEGVPDDYEVYIYGYGSLEHYESRTIQEVTIEGTSVFIDV